MGKKKKEKGGGGMEQPAWLVTFTDMMTLMLTFFVLLVSMATIDERRKLVVLGSIIGTFGVENKSFEVLSTKDSKRVVEPGPMETENVNDLEPLRELLWEDLEEDIDFRSNKFVQVLSINTDILFEPGAIDLKPKGKQILERFLPVFLQIEHPLLLAGHTSDLRDELGVEYLVEDRDQKVDASWEMSFRRVLNIYTFLTDLGMDPANLRMEAFGKHKPRYGDVLPEDRRKNRRVDIVLDKRNTQWLEKVQQEKRPERPNPFVYKDFIFDLKEEK